MIAVLALALVAQTQLDRSRAALAEADFEGALTLAEAAESEASNAAELAEVYKQQGLVREVLGRADHAVVAFARALRCDPRVELDKQRTKRSTFELFALARALHESGANIVEVRQRLDARAGRDEAMCRGPERAVVASAPTASGPPWPAVALGGVAIAGGVVGAIVGALAASKDGECGAQISHETYVNCDASASRLETGANVAWSSAGVAAAGAIFVWFISE